MEAEDEHQTPDDDHRADDQDPGLAQRLAEELKHAPGVDEAEHAAAEARDVAEAREPIARDCEPAAHLITEISGCVASSVWVKTLNAKTPMKAITTASFTARPTPSAPPDAFIPL